MLKDKVIVITGASRGIGRAIALRCAKDGAKLVIAAKTDKPHPSLEGTIYSVAKEVEQLGGQALPLVLDVRDQAAIAAVVAKTVSVFGGIDVLVNNASAISLTSTEDTSMKRYDLMHAVNVRGTYAMSQAVIPYLKKSTNPHILNLSPPLNLNPKWFKSHLAYTMSKYGMSLCVLGMAEEFKSEGIKVNALWPKTTIATAAVAVNFPDPVLQGSRSTDIVADSAYWLLSQTNNELSGNFFIDEVVMALAGVTDLSSYAINPESALYTDLFIDE